MLRNRKLTYIAVAVLALVVVFNIPGAVSLRAKGALRAVISPVERAFSGVGLRFNAAFSALRGLGGMVEKNRELSTELVRVQAKMSALEDLDDQNRRLRRALQFSRQEPREMIPCEVISRNVSGWWKTVRLGQGAKHGVQWNTAVISPDGLVGKTVEVSRKTSEVLLVCDPGCRVSVKVARINAFGVLYGRGVNAKGHPRARMEFINKDTPVREGDEVVTTGLGGIFPKGIHVGYVEKAEPDASGLYQSADVIPGATVGLLDYVFAISDEAPEIEPEVKL